MMKKKTFYILFIFLFFIVVSSPFWGMLLPKKNNSSENRTFEEFKYVTGIGTFNVYFQDQHGFRNFFTSTYIKSYINLFNESPLPNNVVFGQDGWLFVGDYYNDTFASALGVISITESYLNRIVGQVESIQNYCDSIGCQFYVVIAPNKNSIYSEYLPLKPNRKPKLRNIIVPILEEANIKVLDLYSFVKAHKNEHLLYYKTDTHWNLYTGLIVSKYINDSIRKNVKLDSISMADFSIKYQNRIKSGDLARMLGDNNFSDHGFEVVDKRNTILNDSIIRIKQESGSINLLVQTLNKSAKNSSKAIIFRDSFFDAMYKPFISAIKESRIFKQYNFDKKEVDEIIRTYGKPHFILYEVVERNIDMIEYK